MRFIHNEVGYNFRMPNINTALLCAQIKNLEFFFERKKLLNSKYHEFFNKIGLNFEVNYKNSDSNFGLTVLNLKTVINEIIS